MGYIAVNARMSAPGMRDALRRADCAVEEPGSDGKLVTYIPVGQFHGDACTVRARIPREIAELLPRNDVSLHHRSCAVVGNSASLSGKQHGKAIDAHDAVIRINGAPTDGFEVDVGTKTTYDVVNHHHAARIAWPASSQDTAADLQDATMPTKPRRKKRSAVGIGWETFAGSLLSSDDSPSLSAQPQSSPTFEEGRATLVLVESIMYRAYERLYAPLFEHRPPPDTLVLSPSFGLRAIELWYENLGAAEDASASTDNGDVMLTLRSDGRCARHRDGSFARGRAGTTCARPLSGWYATLFAVAICERVNVYGFSDGTSASMHYFDNTTAFQSTHAFGATQRSVRSLAEALPVRLIA